VQGVEHAPTAALLEEEGVHFEYVPNFPLADIDREASLGNQARVADEVNSEWVEDFREAMRRGAKFPALVVAKAGARSAAVNIDGNHRYVAATDEGLDTFGAYVVRIRPGSLQFKSLSARMNATHGHLSPRDERIQHAMWLMDNKGISLERAAADQNLPVSALRSRWEKIRADRRATEVGIRRADWDELSVTARTRLLTIGTDEGFKAAARLTIAAQLKTAEVEDLVSALAEHPRAAAKQEQVVRAFRRDYADQIKQVEAGERRTGRGGFTPRRRVSMALSSLLALPDDFLETTVNSWDPDQRAAGAAQAREGAEKLAALASALEA